SERALTKPSGRSKMQHFSPRGRFVSKNAAKTGTSGPPPRLILASGSRHRRALMERLGVPFEVVPADIDDAALAREQPAGAPTRLAEAKARAVARVHRDALVIGSDQVAELAGEPIGKPRDRADALAQLQRMRGRTVVFHTAVSLVNASTDVCRTALVDAAST